MRMWLSGWRLALMAFAGAVALSSPPTILTTSPLASAAGECLGGYAYVTVNGSNYGNSSYSCLLLTDCTGAPAGAGPASVHVAPINSRIHYWVEVPVPRNSAEAACYVRL